jgi:outer membrane immunogenic protein
MNTSLFATVTAVAGMLIAAPAVADEAPPVKHVRQIERAPTQAAPASAPASQANWTGSQIGGQGGVSPMAQGFAEPGAHLYPVCGPAEFPGSYCVETPFSFTGHGSSGTVGAFLGYRMQFGSMVYGVEGDANYKNASNSLSLYDANAFRTETFTGSIKQTGDGSIRGRAGFLVTPWTLLYGTGGVAFGNVSGAFSYLAHEIDGCRLCSAVNGGGSWSDTRVGWTGGGGVETIIATGLTLRLEYRYTDLGEYSKAVPLATSCPVSGVCTSPTSGATIDLHPAFHAVRIGLGYNF